MNLSKLAMLAILTCSLASCKKDDDEPDPEPEPTTGTVKLSLTFINGSTAFDMNALVPDGGGHNVRFDTLKFFASGFEMTDDADVVIAEFPSAVVLANAANASNLFTLGTMNVGHVHEVHIKLGLDIDLNDTDPTTAASPLNQMDMYLGSGMGYRFLKMSGRIDGNNDGDVADPEDTPFSYTTGTDALLREAHVHMHVQVVGGGTVTAQGQVDVAKIISGLDLMATPLSLIDQPGSIQAMDSLAVAIDEL